MPAAAVILIGQLKEVREEGTEVLNGLGLLSLKGEICQAAVVLIWYRGFWVSKVRGMKQD